MCHIWQDEWSQQYSHLYCSNPSTLQREHCSLHGLTFVFFFWRKCEKESKTSGWDIERSGASFPLIICKWDMSNRWQVNNTSQFNIQGIWWKNQIVAHPLQSAMPNSVLWKWGACQGKRLWHSPSSAENRKHFNYVSLCVHMRNLRPQKFNQPRYAEAPIKTLQSGQRAYFGVFHFH